MKLSKDFYNILLILKFYELYKNIFFLEYFTIYLSLNNNLAYKYKIIYFFY